MTVPRHCQSGSNIQILFQFFLEHQMWLSLAVDSNILTVRYCPGHLFGGHGVYVLCGGTNPVELSFCPPAAVFAFVSWRRLRQEAGLGSAALSSVLSRPQGRCTAWRTLGLRSPCSVLCHLCHVPVCGVSTRADRRPYRRRSMLWRPVRWHSTQASWSCRTALLTPSLCSSRRWKMWCCPRRWTCWCLSGWGPACW